MNRENIIKVRDVIAGLPAERFDMVDYVGYVGVEWRGPVNLKNDCDTCACVAGWVTAVIPGFDREGVAYFRFATRAFDLDRTVARSLFLPEGSVAGGLVYTATPAHAVAVLDHLLETGKVDWDAAFAKVEAAQ